MRPAMMHNASSANRPVLLVAPSLTAFGGGIELCCRQILAAVVAARPDAPVAALLGRESRLGRPELLPPLLGSRLSVSGGSGWTSFLIAAGRLFSTRPGVIICGHLHYLPVAAALARVTGAKLISLLHGVEVWNRGHRLAHLAAARADLTVAVSGFTAAQALRFLPVTAGRVVVAPNAVDTARFSPGEPDTATLARLASLRRPLLLTVSRLDAIEGYKGVDEVLRALATMSDPPSYVVAGDGSDLPRLRALAAALRVDVTFLGQVSDETLVSLYRAADLFIMASRNEGFGFVFIEALSTGTPVIAGGVDGSVEALDGGRLGLLVDPLDPGAIARAISDSLAGRTVANLRDPVWLRKEVQQRFGLEAFHRRWAAILERVSS